MRTLLTRSWHDDEVQQLISMLGRLEPVYRMARRLHRSESSVRAKIKKLGMNVSKDTITLRKMRRAVFGQSGARFN